MLILNQQSPDRLPPFICCRRCCQWRKQPSTGSVQFFFLGQLIQSTKSLTFVISHMLAKTGASLNYNLPFTTWAFHVIRLNLKHQKHCAK